MRLVMPDPVDSPGRRRRQRHRGRKERELEISLPERLPRYAQVTPPVCTYFLKDLVVKSWRVAILTITMFSQI